MSKRNYKRKYNLDKANTKKLWSKKRMLKKMLTIARRSIRNCTVRRKNWRKC